jgi:hypothetical protein
MLVTDISVHELRATVPPLGSQEDIRDPIVHLRFFSHSGWIWYVTEGSPEDDDFIFFGFVIALEQEWGQFSLLELTEAGLHVKRDLHFEPAPLSQVLAREFA